MQSLSMFGVSTGFRVDSETSSIMDQYGPGRRELSFGGAPEASFWVESDFEAGGWLFGE